MNSLVEVSSRVVIAGLLMGVLGCGSAPTRFYVLHGLSDAKTRGAERGPAVGVGPVELPQYVDRPQIVTQSSENRLELSEFDQWAEPLQDNFTRVLAENLGTLLPTDRVFIFPWRSSSAIDYQVTLAVNRFIGRRGGDAHLTARWTIIDEKARKTLVTTRSSFSEATGGPGFDAMVAALSRTIGILSRDIAGAIRLLQGEKRANTKPKPTRKRRSRPAQRR